MSQQGFFNVAEYGEISNRDLIKDIFRIIKLHEPFETVFIHLTLNLVRFKLKFDNSPLHFRKDE
jgi:hypothetical protein